MKARDVMTAESVPVRANTSTRDIARLLLERGISAVPVVDEVGALVARPFTSMGYHILG